MSAQIRLQDGTLIDPHRDVAHLLHSVVTHVGELMSRGHWPEVTKLIEAAGVTDQQLGEACKAYILTMAEGVKHPDENIAQVMKRTGFDALPEAAKVAHQAYLGLIMSGLMFQGMRDASLGTLRPSLEAFYASGAAVAEKFVKPPYRPTTGPCVACGSVLHLDTQGRVAPHLHLGSGTACPGSSHPPR